MQKASAEFLRRWRAVKNRRTAADGSFVYAVQSTGIYCRPSCPSRRPAPRRVVFFPAPADAERAGFRPCRRCKPQLESLPSEEARQVRRICWWIADSVKADPEKRLTLAELSLASGLSPHKLERLFRRILGITPRQFADGERMRQLKTGLRKGEKVTTALYDAGFGSSSRLYERADAQMGMTPDTYRRGGAGMKIGYTIVTCTLGRLLVGATARGVSAVCLGDSDGPLKKALALEYPRAEIKRDGKRLARWVNGILRHLCGQEPHMDLPLDVQATAFERRVWEELRRIPYGATRTYSEVARAIGKPKAVRAVARACSTNPVSVVVPCHRVVRKDGGPSGYRWGAARKRALIAREREAARRRT